MKVFSEIIVEAKQNTFAITQEEFDKYKEAIEKTKRSKEFLKLLWIVGQCSELFEKETIEAILNGKNVKTSDRVTDSLKKDIYKLGKTIGTEVKLLPQFLTTAQRDAVIMGKIDPAELTLDLETPKGRDAVVRQYARLIEKLVRQYDGTSPLTKDELRSAALLGLVNAMNDYKNPEEMEKAGKEGNMSFTSYAAYRIKQQILDDIEEYSRNVTISNYYQNKLRGDDGEGSVPAELSIDRSFGRDEDDEPISIDRFFGLHSGDSASSSAELRDAKDAYDKIFKRIESKFSSRDCIMFYKIFGANGYKKEKVSAIAKQLGISSPAVTQACKRIIKFIASDPYCKSLKSAFEALTIDYAVNKIMEVYTEKEDVITESFLFDDIYVLLESLQKWNSKEKFQKAVNKATDLLNVDDALFIYKVLKGDVLFDDKACKKYHGAIVRFLEDMYPNKSFKKEPISEIIAELNDLAVIAQDFKIEW